MDSKSCKRILTKTEKEKAAYMIDMYKLNRTDLNTERKYFFRDIVNDDKYYVY